MTNKPELRCCCDCRNQGAPMSMPIEAMHKRISNGRTMYYCDVHWSQRQEAMRKRA